MAADIPLPGSVYQDVLEEKFLLRAYAERWHAQTAGTIAPALSMASRNDLVAEAMQQLKPPHRQMFLDYLESLVAALPSMDLCGSQLGRSSLSFSSGLCHELLMPRSCVSSWVPTGIDHL